MFRSPTSSRSASQPGSLNKRPLVAPSPTSSAVRLGRIRDHIAASLVINAEDFEGVPFVQHGGLGKAYELFGEQLTPLLDELTEVLAA